MEVPDAVKPAREQNTICILKKKIPVLTDLKKRIRKHPKKALARYL